MASRCRAKNPSRCSSPRCPDKRSGGYVPLSISIPQDVHAVAAQREVTKQELDRKEAALGPQVKRAIRTQVISSLADVLAVTSKRSSGGVPQSQARQQHGFDFEGEVLRALNLESQSYTAEADGILTIHAAHKDWDIPVSVKTHGATNEIGLGSYARNLTFGESSGAPALLLVEGIYSTGRDIDDLNLYYIPGSTWRSFFDSETLADYESALKAVTNSREDDDKWRDLRAAAQTTFLAKNPSPIVYPRAKRDHGTQKRIQAGIRAEDISRLNRWKVAPVLAKNLLNTIKKEK